MGKGVVLWGDWGQGGGSALGWLVKLVRWLLFFFSVIFSQVEA